MAPGIGIASVGLVPHLLHICVSSFSMGLTKFFPLEIVNIGGQNYEICKIKLFCIFNINVMKIVQGKQMHRNRIFLVIFFMEKINIHMYKFSHTTLFSLNSVPIFALERTFMCECTKISTCKN